MTRGKKRGKKRGHIDCDRSEIEALIENFTCFEHVEKFVKPYVSKVIRKAVHGGYQSAGEVFDDYKIFNSLRTKLTKGKYKLLVESYAAEFVFYYALEKKAKMLHHFSTMLSESEAALPGEHKDWIRAREDEENADALLSYALEYIAYWDNLVSELDTDVQSQIGEKGYFLKMIRLEVDEFQADNFVKKKGEFEELNSKISSTEKLLDKLFKRSTSYYETLWNVGDQSTLKLRKAFLKLLRYPAEEELAILWSRETQNMEKLLQKEKEQEKNAIEICKASLGIGSSGRI